MASKTYQITCDIRKTRIMEAHWSTKPIKNILLDINGVLFESGEEHAIEGSVEAMKNLVDQGFNFCLVTNECTLPKRLLAAKLNKFGFDCVEPSKLVSPAPVACQYLMRHKLKPRLHVWDGVLEDFQPSLDKVSKDEQPNCLVVGDAMGKISRDYIDESLGIMLACREEPKIVSLGAGRYYKDAGRLRMDTGAYVAAFEYCLGVKAINIGKPTEAFFQEALAVVGGTVDDTIMIGDDIVSDVGGAQALGMRAFLVRTGKYMKSDETDKGVTADHVFDDLKQAIETIIAKGLANSKLTSDTIDN